MYIPHSTKQFKKDVDRMRKHGKDMDKLIILMTELAAGKTLSIKHRDHKLIGDYAHHRECHIEPDWLLIYRIDENLIFFERTGTHANLFR